MNRDEYCSLEAAAELLHVRYETVLAWVRDGQVEIQRDPLSHGNRLFLLRKQIARLRRLHQKD